MKRMLAFLITIFLSLPVVVFVQPISGKTPQTSSTQPASISAENHMKTIRRIAQKPRVKQVLQSRGLSDKELTQRLATLASSLNTNQKQQLAQKLTQIESQRKKEKQSIASGKPFLGSTVDILTEILLIPVKILSFLIPGL